MISNSPEVKPPFFIESYRGSVAAWNSISNEVLSVHSKVGELLVPKRYQEFRLDLERDFTSQSTIGVLLRTHSDRALVGFSYAKPASDLIWKLSQRVYENVRRKLRNDEYIELHNRSVEIGWTEVLNEYPGQEGWDQMMDVLDDLIIQEGRYSNMVRVERIEGGEADRAKKRYRNQILFEDDINGIEDVGMQKFLRVKL
jgi:hypothetical protein